jgi:hypothetical protein
MAVNSANGQWWPFGSNTNLPEDPLAIDDIDSGSLRAEMQNVEDHISGKMVEFGLNVFIDNLNDIMESYEENIINMTESLSSHFDLEPLKAGSLPGHHIVSFIQERKDDIVSAMVDLVLMNYGNSNGDWTNYEVQWDI